MRIPLLCLSILLLCTCVRAQIRLDVSEDGTHLVHSDSRAPFFYLGDTAWELLHRCNEQEIRSYLIDRAGKGFNVIQCVALAELDGLTVPNTNGDLPLTDLDPARPNEAYFRHVDFAARIADSLDIFLGLLPTWGDKFNKKWGVGPEVFTPQNAETYANYLGLRYADNNVIWILGGDRNPEEPDDYAIVRAMAKGLRVAVEDLQLITYHPQGGSRSSDFFAKDEWIDFHMFQSGHGRQDDKQNYDLPRQVKAAVPGKPVINGEPAYEYHPINWRADNGFFDDFDTRQAAWWSVLAGTAGHTFGNANIWQMWQPGRAPVSVVSTDWHEAVHWPAAAQMGHLKQLMESLPYWELSPDFNLFQDAPNSSGREVIAARTKDSDLVIAYTPYGNTLRLQQNRLPATTSASWFDPRTGTSFEFTPRTEGNMLVFDPPYDVRRGNDWVLVLRQPNR